MLVDDYEHVEYNNDRTDVIVVSHSGSEEEPESEPLANDCKYSFLIVVGISFAVSSQPETLTVLMPVGSVGVAADVSSHEENGC
jgi:hypothetical protein